MLINPSSNSIYFTIFYTLAFFFAFIMLLWEGTKRKIPTIPWVLLLILYAVFFIVGTKIFTYTRDEWLSMVKHATLIPTSGKILFGGIVLGFTALLTGKYVLRIKENVFDAFAIVFPLSIGIQRIGCFFNGCCFGKPTTLPWSVQYPVNTVPHYHHFESGLIGINDMLSLHIHPVQLYETAGAFFAAFVVFKTRKYWKSRGSLFAFSLLLYCIVRFATEFFRDNLAHTVGGEMLGILNQIQWTMLIAIVFLTLVLLYREKKIVVLTQSPLQSKKFGIKLCLFIFIFEALLFWNVRYWFTFSELIAVLLIFVTSSILFFYWILKELVSSKTKMIYAGLLILPLFITSQTIPQSQSDSTLVKKTRKISFGLSSGNIENSLTKQTGTTSDGCAQYQTEYFKQKSTVGGVGYSVKLEYPEKKYSTNYGVNVYLGQNTEVVNTDGSETKTLLYGVNPYVKFETNWLGIGGGIHVGKLIHPIPGNNYSGDFKTGLVKMPVFPQIYFRVGPKRWLFIDYHLADQFITPFPVFYQELGLGSGLSLGNGTIIRGGLLIPPDDRAVNRYFSAYLPINNDFSLEPMLLFSGGYGNQFSLGIHYNLSSKFFYENKKKIVNFGY
jgi:prolipoprotein diacylglyceryltransferase